MTPAPEELPAETSWYRIDLHVHTAASADYQEPGVSALDILRKAEERGLNAIAFTDHNSVRGYADLWREIEDLELLEFLNRLAPDEAARLADYRRLLSRILLLPGFEFTATFGFHILAIFPEQTSVRMMEHLLLTLGVPEGKFGSGDVGATTDVIRAYKLLADHDALVIGAHANSTHGVAMQGLRFGGQTKIAYTQDSNLHALEVTDLHLDPHRRSTARFFSGTKAEYPRQMHCIQGSDAHRLDRDPQRESNLGVGERTTEVMLPAVSFRAIKELFLTDDFSRTRPFTSIAEGTLRLRTVRAEGNSTTQAFHERLSTKRTGSAHILKDVVALANSNGGAVYVGASPFDKRPVVGVNDSAAAIESLQTEIFKEIAPSLTITTEIIESERKTVLVVKVPRGVEPPYALAPGSIYVRRDAESVLASRDEIVRMVRSGAASARPIDRNAGDREHSPSRGRRRARSPITRRDQPDLPLTREASTAEPTAPMNGRSSSAVPILHFDEEQTDDAAPDAAAPTSGVEILDSTELNGTAYYTLRDLRNQKIIHNVTRSTPSRIRRYAIEQYEDRPVDEGRIRWKGDHGFWKSYKPRGGDQRYNLAHRGNGRLRIFYAVGEDGIDDNWRVVLPTRRRQAKIA